jgi:hypothetical protein
MHHNVLSGVLTEFPRGAFQEPVYCLVRQTLSAQGMNFPRNPYGDKP